jgi:YhcH/YjgK/YiaL family protein
MVLDQLRETASLSHLNVRFKQAFDFLLNTDLTALEPGKINLDGDALYVSIVEMDGKKPENAKMETHRQYIDIQVVIAGAETMGWTPVEKCTEAVDAYNPVKDIQFFSNTPSTYFTLKAGDYAVFFPEDGHAPGIGDGRIKKAIVKVSVS